MKAGRPPIAQSHYPNRVREVREARGWSLYKTGQLAGWSTSTQKRYETGEHQIPVPRLEKLAKVFGVPTHELLNDAGPDQAKRVRLLQIELSDLSRQMDEAELARLIKIARALASSDARLRVV